MLCTSEKDGRLWQSGFLSTKYAALSYCYVHLFAFYSIDIYNYNIYNIYLLRLEWAVQRDFLCHIVHNRAAFNNFHIERTVIRKTELGLNLD